MTDQGLRRLIRYLQKQPIANQMSCSGCVLDLCVCGQKNALHHEVRLVGV